MILAQNRRRTGAEQAQNRRRTGAEKRDRPRFSFAAERASVNCRYRRRWSSPTNGGNGWWKPTEKGFFDRIHHDRLIARVGEHVPDKRILRLTGKTLCSGVLAKGLMCPTTEETVQGRPLSPLLSNIVLDELDRELERRGLASCRFADDRNIFVRTPKAAERVVLLPDVQQAPGPAHPLGVSLRQT
jgi:hypothetical protein